MFPRQWIFFDLDGTLADAIPAMYEVYLSFLKDFKVAGTPEEFETLNGPSLAEVITILKERYGLEPDEQSLLALYREKIADLYAKKIQPMPGAKGILDKMRGLGYGMTLVTAAPKRLADDFIKSQSWEDYFEHFVYGDEIESAKPNPDIYQLALKRSGTAREHTLAIEDSTNGIRSAVSAGVPVISVSPKKLHQQHRELGAESEFEDLNQALNYIAHRTETVFLGEVVIEECDIDHNALISNTTERAIDEVWQRALSSSRDIRDGDFFHIHDFQGSKGRAMIRGGYVPYRFHLAAQEIETLCEKLHPLGVSGITIVSDSETEYVIVGKRSSSTAHLSDRLELVPSGALDSKSPKRENALDFKAKLLEELEEELGCSASKVRDIQCLGLIFDSESNIYDVCCRVHLDHSPSEIENLSNNNDEYDWITLVPMSESIQFFRESELQSTSSTFGLLRLLEFSRTP